MTVKELIEKLEEFMEAPDVTVVIRTPAADVNCGIDTVSTALSDISDEAGTVLIIRSGFDD